MLKDVRITKIDSDLTDKRLDGDVGIRLNLDHKAFLQEGSLSNVMIECKMTISYVELKTDQSTPTKTSTESDSSITTTNLTSVFFYELPKAEAKPMNKNHLKAFSESRLSEIYCHLYNKLSQLYSIHGVFGKLPIPPSL